MILSKNTIPLGTIIIRPQETADKPADIYFVELAIIENKEDKNNSQLVARSVMIDIRNIREIEFQ